MCYSSSITKIISIAYLVICILVPIAYICIYCIKVKKSRWKLNKVFALAFIIFILLFSIKLVAKIDINAFNCIDCYLNNSCEKKESKDDSMKDNKKTTTSTTTTTTTTTTTKVIVDPNRNMKESYPKIPVIEGEVIDKGVSRTGFRITEVNGVTYVDDYLIVNKTYALPSTYYPINAHVNAKTMTYMCINCIDEIAYQAWLDMQADAKLDGLTIANRSGYRPYVCQRDLYASYVKRDGQEMADTYSARAGHSEHQSGYAFDINKAHSSFNNTPEAKWIHDNAYKYGYILRFPEGKTDETGYKYESWHVRYVGTDLSYKLYQDGEYITLEAYFGLDSQYATET